MAEGLPILHNHDYNLDHFPVNLPMRLDFRSPKPFLIFFGSFCAGFLCFILLENTQRISSNATAQPSEAAAPQSDAALSQKQKAATAGQGGKGEFVPEGSQRPDPQAATGTRAGGETDAAAMAELASAKKPTAALAQLKPTPALGGTHIPAGAAGANSAGAGSPGVQAPAAAPNPFALANQPNYEIAWAHPTNYGQRFTQDIFKQPATQKPIVVLHETVSSADSAINYFQTPHPNDEDQASYHTLIRRNGVVVYLVPPEKRAYGAGNSVFIGPDGKEETIKTHKEFASSVNNFAYHISLESPPDGYGDAYSHSGYTQAQYNSLAWLIGQSNVPIERITTHQLVDRSGERVDPRSFEPNRLMVALRPYRNW